MSKILVTGATGNVGGPVFAFLCGQGADAVAGVRNPDRVAGAAVRLDFGQPDSFADALSGVTSVFLVRPPDLTDVGPTINRFLDQAVRAGVEQVVFLSVIGAERLPFIPHAKIERHLNGLPLRSTFLRVGYFAQNFGGVLREGVRSRNEIILPAGRMRLAFIDTRDVAEVAARLLVGAVPACKALELTGQELLSLAEVAGIFSQVLGRPVHYRNPSILAFVSYLRGLGMGWGRTAITTILNSSVGLSPATRVCPDVTSLLPRPARALREYLQDYADLWKH